MNGIMKPMISGNESSLSGQIVAKLSPFPVYTRVNRVRPFPARHGDLNILPGLIQKMSKPWNSNRS